MTHAMNRVTEALSDTPPRLAYAFQVVRLLAHLGMDRGQPAAALLEAAMLSDRLTGPDGAIAAKMKDVVAQFPSSEGLEGNCDARDLYVALALAATLRPTLLAPRTGAHTVLFNVKPSDRLDAVFTLTREITNATRNLPNDGVDSTVLKTAISQIEWQEYREQLQDDAKSWLSTAPSRTILYAPATAVWQQWVTDGPIAKMLNLIISGSDKTGFIVTTRDQLTKKKEFRQLVKNTDRKTIGRQRGNDIYARALEQLSDHARQSAVFADRYLRLLESQPESGFIAQTLATLRANVTKIEQIACDQLDMLVSNGTSRLLASAAKTAIYAIDQFRSLFEKSVSDIELDPETLRGSALLHFPSIAVNDDGLPDGDPRQALETLVSDVPASLRRSFQHRLDMGDFATSRRIIKWLEVSEDNDTQNLKQKWDKTLGSEKIGLHHKIANTRTEVSKSLARGYISDSERTEHDAVLAEIEIQLADSEKIIFSDDRSRICEIVERLDTAKKDRHDEAMKNLSDLDVPVGNDQRRRIEKLIKDGDIPAAYEIMTQIRTGSSSQVSPAVSRDMFRDFYPERCESINSYLENVAPQRVLGAVERDGLLGGMVLSRLPGARRTSAVRMLKAWYRLKKNHYDSQQQRDATRQRVMSLFSEMGFDVQGMDVTRSGPKVGYAEMQTAPLRTRELCPIPVFGSAAEGRYRIVLLWDRPTVEDMLQHAEDSPRRTATILLYFGRLTKTQRDSVAVLARKRLRTLLVIDELLLVFLCGVRDSRVPALFTCATPFTYGQPYITTAGLVPPEMFYGREDEMREIADLNGSCFIYGGRQLGKTALLRAVERREHLPTEKRYAIWIDLRGEGVGYDRNADDIWSSIWRALRKHRLVPDKIKDPTPNVRGRIDQFVGFLTDYFNQGNDRILLLLLDEADMFLEVDAREVEGKPGTGYQVSSRLKILMDQTSRSIKIVFAGLHNVLRTVEYSNHPLGHFGHPIQVGPLWRDAEELIRQPLLSSGYRFENDNLVARILAQTNYYPNLIQMYCSELVRSMCKQPISGGPLYDISEVVVDQTYQSTHLRDMIRQRFHMTLQLDQRYEVIAYAIADQCIRERTVLSRGLHYRNIDKITRGWWPDGFEDVEPYTDLFRSLLDEMVGLGVLRKADDDYHYTMRNPNVLPFMGTTEEIEDNLVRDRELRPPFQQASFRAHDPQDADGPSRSPLTYEQERRLRAGKNGVSVVCGLKAADYDHVLRFLSKREAADSYIEINKPLDHVGFENEIIRHLERRIEGTTIYAVPDSVPWSERWVQVAMDGIQRLRSGGRYARVLFMTDPLHLFELLPALDALTDRGINWITLRPWREDFMRQWMDDVGFATGDIRARVIELTGGWPNLLTRLHELWRAVDLDRSLDKLDDELTNPNKRDRFIRDLGLDDTMIRKVLSILANLESPDFDELEEFVRYDKIPADLRRILKWAELLHLVRSEGDSWKANRVVTRLLPYEG